MFRPNEVAMEKILVCGDVCGEFASLATKITKIDSKHGPFTALFCVGQFFHADGHQSLEPFLSEQSKFPIPLYFIAGEESSQSTSLIDSLPDGGALCHNIHYLGRSGVKTVGGLKVAYLSGVYDTDSYFDTNTSERRVKYHSYYNEDEALAIKRTAGEDECDILFTCEWARNWHSLLSASQIPPDATDPSRIGSPVVAKLATQLRIRYHFAAHEDIYFELPPYKNHDYYTRFFALGSHASSRKQKSLYACNIALLSKVDLSSIPPNVTACPYTINSAKSREKPALDGQSVNKLARTPAGFVRAGASSTLPSNMPTASMIDGDNQARWDMTPMTRSQQNPPPRTYVCRICSEPGHWIDDCPQKVAREPRDENIPPSGYVCKICNVPGHWLKNCSQLGKVPAGYKCNKCGSDQHFIQNCPAVLAEKDTPPPDYRCKKCDGHHWIRLCPLVIAEEEERAARKAKQSEPVAGGVEAAGCWLCLSTTDSPHLIVSIGDTMYCAIPKGSLVDDHCLIMPVDHVTSQSQFSDEQTTELSKYKQALKDCYAAQSMSIIFFERNIPTRAGQHCHVNCIPLPNAVAESAQQFIEKEAAKLGADFEVVESIKSAVTDDAPYLWFELPDGTQMMHRVVKGKIAGLFDFQRECLAAMIKKPDRADWKHCRLDEAKETELTDQIKEKFAPFDFTAIEE